MIDQFKDQARASIKTKQKMMDEMGLLLKSKDDRIVRIRERIAEKKKHGLDSESEGEPEPQKPEIVAKVNEYKKIKA